MSQNLDKKIAIIIPAYNIETFIAQCLESLINQTYKNIEIIIVNDGSKDDTLNIITEYAKKDNRIKIINQENQGLSESRNNAMQIVSDDVEYIMFVDGDDWIDLETCEECIKEFGKENPEIVWFAYVREYEKVSLPKGAFETGKIIIEGNEIKDKIHRRLYGPYKQELSHPEKLDVLSPVWGKIYKKSIIKNQLFKSFKVIGASCEDVFFNAEVFENVNKIVYINKNFYHYRKFNPNSLTKEVDVNLFEKWKKAYRLLAKMIDEKKFDNTYKQALKNRFAINLIAIGLRIKNSSNNFTDKFRMIKDILNDEIYCDAVKDLDISNMPIHWKAFFWNAKHKFTLMVYLLLVIMNYLAKKK